MPDAFRPHELGPDCWCKPVWVTEHVLRHNGPPAPPALTEQQYWADGGPPTAAEVAAWNEESAPESQARPNAATEAERLRDA